MTSAYNGLEDRLREIGDNLRSPPTSVDELLLLLDRTERLLLKVEQSPSQSMINAIRPAMNALVAEELLRHPNVDVRVSVASCTSEITIITAPDPPYDDDLMKVVFQRIVEALEKLDDMSSSLYSKRVSILETMARVRSCVVMLDLECDDLILHMFHHFLNTIRLNHPANVFSSMETIMTLVVEESEDISPKLVSCLLESLKKDSKELNPTAFRLAKKVVSNCGVKLNPALIKLVQNTPLSNYSKVVGSLCQENSDATDCTDVNDSGKNVADNSKLSERAVSDELPQMDHREEVGPVDPSVLSDQASHRSSYVRAEGYAPVQFTEHGRKLNSWTVEHPGVVDLLRQAGFFYVSRLKRVQLDQALLGALTERWRRETESFHLRHGEMTVTLRDVAIIAGLRVSGEPVTGRASGDWLYICHRLLGIQPDDVVAGQIRLDWLFQQFHHVALDAPPAVVAAAARAYILFQIGCSLFPNPTGYRVHLKWLPLLEDFDLCGGLAWGAATLAHLYCALGNASMRGRAECCAFGTLLQIWAWDHIRIGRPDRVGAPPDLHVCPLGSRWNMRLRFRENVRATDIEFYRDELDQQWESQIIWIPYTEEILHSLPSFCLEGSAVWRARTCLICFNIVELHLPDRVLRQFGLVQHIPEPVEAIRRISSQCRSGEDWAAFHISYILRWADRLNNIVEQSPFVDPDPTRATSLYMQWYWKITRRWISRPVQRSSLTFLPRGHIERILVDLIRRTARSLRHLIDDLPEPSRMIDVLRHIMWDIENVLERLPTLAVSGYSEHPEPPPYFYHPDDVLSTSTPAYNFPSASVPIHPSDVPSTSDVLHFDF